MKKKKIISKTVVYITIIACVAAFFLSGCEMKQSGLYMVNLDEQNSEDVNTDIKQEEQPEQLSLEAEKYSEQADIVTGQQANTETIQQTEIETDIIFVHVCGEVLEPGVYELSDNSRVFDAIEAAGGFTENAYEDYVNLASVINDGDKIIIPSLEEKDELSTQAGVQSDRGYSDKSTSLSDASGGVSGGATVNNMVDINRASVSELCSISGIGETKAEAIVEYRNANGYFGKTEDIMNVSGIGEGTFSKIKDKITVGQ